MKLTNMLVGLLAIATIPAFAGEIVAKGIRTSPGLDGANKALEACTNAFVEQIIPGQKFKLRASLSNFDSKEAEAAGRYEYLAYAFTMTAQLRRDSSRLADSTCTATRYGRILKFSVDTNPRAQLAGLAPKDIRLAMVD